jgi:predicted methyltransferase
MKILKAQMFNKKASDQRNKPDEIIEAIGLKSGHTVADIGAGGGYFSLTFAELIGEAGKVYAVDINPEFLQFIKDNSEKKD